MKNPFIYSECARLSVAAPDIEVPAREYFGQCGEDLIIVSLIQAVCVREGLDPSQERYLEIGANHPIATSATYLLHRELAMTGVLVEANNALIGQLREIRPFDTVLEAAVTASDQDDIEFFVSEKSELSSVSRRFVEEWAQSKVGIREIKHVSAIRIDRVLSQHFASKVPIFIAIDIEGMDLSVVNDIDFIRWRPALVQVEPSDFFAPGTTAELLRVLSKHGYVLVAKTDVNLIFADHRRIVSMAPLYGDDCRELTFANPVYNLVKAVETTLAEQTRLLENVSEEMACLNEKTANKYDEKLLVSLSHVWSEISKVRGEIVASAEEIATRVNDSHGKLSRYIRDDAAKRLDDIDIGICRLDSRNAVEESRLETIERKLSEQTSDVNLANLGDMLLSKLDLIDGKLDWYVRKAGESKVKSMVVNVAAAALHPVSSLRRREFRRRRKGPSARRARERHSGAGYGGLRLRIVAWCHYPFDSGKRKAFRKVNFPATGRELSGERVILAGRLWLEIVCISAALAVPGLSARMRRRFDASRDKRKLRIAEEVGCGERIVRAADQGGVPCGGFAVGRCAPLRRASYEGPALKLCIAVHAYDLDVAGELLAKVKNVVVPCDVFITTSYEKVRGVENLCRTVLPGRKVQIVGCENRGRNFGALLVGLRNEIMNYDLILHLHTKKSIRTGHDQSGWRRDIVEHLAGSTTIVNGILSVFSSEPKVGVIGPRIFPDLPYWTSHWLSNSHLAPKLLESVGVINYARRGYIEFPVGGMFWARPKALEPLLRRRWEYEDFSPEPMAADGTPAHVIERAVGVVCEFGGYLYGETDVEKDIIRLGEGEKGLSRYFATVLERVEHIKRNKRVVSLDFYDTLFTRKSVTPEDVQSYVGHVLGIEGLVPDGADFLLLRSAAEGAARSAKGQGDVSLEEIYAAFPDVCEWTPEAMHRALELESTIEEKVLEPRHQILAYCRAFAAAGCRLIIVSDTYMNEQFVRRVLDRYGVDDLFVKVYCSCDIGRRKDNGSMWAWLRAKEEADSQSFVHIGDNEQSDLQKAGDTGIETFGIINTAVLASLRKCPMPTGWREARSDWRAGIVLGPLVARVGNDPFEPDPRLRFMFRTAKQFGYAVLGPLAFGFMSWLVRSARRDKISRLYFFARGGYFLHRAYQSLAASAGGVGLPRASYLLVSRRATLPAAFALDPDPTRILAGVGGFHGSFGELLKARLGLAPDALSPSISAIHLELPGGVGKPSLDREKAAELIREHLGAISEHCATAAELLRGYLSGAGFFDAGRIGVVDLGYSATIQRALQTAAGRGLHGYYFAMTPTATAVGEGGGTASACFGEEEPGGAVPDIMRCSLLLEALFAAPAGQVSAYKQVGDEVVPVYVDEPDSGPHFPELVAAADGMQAYCADITRAYGPEALLIEVPPDEAIKPLLALVGGWGGIPAALQRALTVEDAFCGNGNLDALAVEAPYLKR
jgi:FkbM family methyltransferase